MSAFYHEELQRGRDALARMQDCAVTVCGAGALGANIAEGLARAGFGRLVVIDHDRVEERNLSTQPYLRADIGAHKAKILANMLYRAVGAPVEARVKTLHAHNAGRLLANGALVIDTFDNSVARRAVTEWCASNATPALHVGLSSGYGEAIWNEDYRVPSAANDDLCDYPLARNLVSLTAAVACEVVVGFATDGQRRGYTVTLADLAVRAAT